MTQLVEIIDEILELLKDGDTAGALALVADAQTTHKDFEVGFMTGVALAYAGSWAREDQGVSHQAVDDFLTAAIPYTIDEIAKEARNEAK